MTHRPATARGSGRSSQWAPFALIALVLIPAIFGSLRLIGLAGGPQLMPADPRMTTSPLPVIVHILSALTYALSAPSSSRLGSGAAVPAGTGRPVESWSSWAWRWRSRRCG